MAHILNVLNKETGEYVGIPAITGENGKDGKSAYEIALDNGFEGTEEEWLESLKSTETQVDLSNYYNKEEVDNAIANAEVDVDLTNYYTKTEVDSIVDNVEVDVDMSNYYTKEEVNNVIDNIEVNGVVDELTVKRKSDDNSIIELPYEFDETLKDATLDPLRVYTNSTVETNFTFDKMLYLIADRLPESVGINEYKELAYSDNMTISGIAEDQYLVDYLIFNPKLSGENSNSIFKSEIRVRKTLDDFDTSETLQDSAYIWDEENQRIASVTYIHNKYEDGHVFERTLYYFHFYPNREYTITMTNGTAVYKPYGYDDFVDGWTFLDCQTLSSSVTLPGSARGADYVSPTGGSGDGFYIAPENGASFTVSDGTNTMTFNSNGIVNAPQYELTVTNGSESNTVVFTLTSENGEYYVRQRDIQIVTRYDMDNLGGSGSVDLTGYATETYVDNKVTGYATTSYVDSKVATKALVTNAQNFKIDLTKRNASWYGMFTFNFVYGTTPCEITVAITDKVYYTITKGQNLVSAITYTQDGAKYTIGISLTATVYGTQVVDMPSEFGTINSLTAETFAGDTTVIAKASNTLRYKVVTSAPATQEEGVLYIVT